MITHSVTELLEEVSKIVGSFQAFLDYGRELDRHYIGSRYPNLYPSGPAYKYYTKEIADRCLSYAGSILREVERFLRR
ncbi:HEPN domain-containing protein [Candidatus Bathyarchaeota archaeon]|nr:HEPN domain-containing protein [Candidatus Bathyarchaeota archaeon]